MKSVLISIQPKWCELIALGKKTVEVRKTKPKLETPFKVYIYCTKDNTFTEKTLRGFDENGKAIYYKANKGKVIGEFVCNRITYLGNISTDKWEYLSGSTHEYHKQLVTNNACLTENEMLEYGGKYGWHITDLVVYDKPRELSEFYNNCNGLCFDNSIKYRCIRFNPDCPYACDHIKPLKRPPQSWCYVESEDTE
jgi:predicted transcriptional regulator